MKQHSLRSLCQTAKFGLHTLQMNSIIWTSHLKNCALPWHQLFKPCLPTWSFLPKLLCDAVTAHTFHATPKLPLLHCWPLLTWQWLNSLKTHDHACCHGLTSVSSSNFTSPSFVTFLWETPFWVINFLTLMISTFHPPSPLFSFPFFWHLRCTSVMALFGDDCKCSSPLCAWCNGTWLKPVGSDSIVTTDKCEHLLGSD